MKRICLSSFIISFSLIFIFTYAFPADSKPAQVRKQPEIQQVKPRKPVKIKLKRSPDGKYTWDLTGDDVDQIVRVDKRLKKLLNTE